MGFSFFLFCKYQNSLISRSISKKERQTSVYKHTRDAQTLFYVFYLYLISFISNFDLKKKDQEIKLYGLQGEFV